VRDLDKCYGGKLPYFYVASIFSSLSLSSIKSLSLSLFGTFFIVFACLILGRLFEIFFYRLSIKVEDFFVSVASCLS